MYKQEKKDHMSSKVQRNKPDIKTKNYPKKHKRNVKQVIENR